MRVKSETTLYYVWLISREPTLCLSFLIYKMETVKSLLSIVARTKGVFNKHWLL